ncbi:hypothetical protein A6R68_06643, partial [Neotoma lepida]
SARLPGKHRVGRVGPEASGVARGANGTPRCRGLAAGLVVLGPPIGEKKPPAITGTLGTGEGEEEPSGVERVPGFLSCAQLTSF